MCIKYCTWDQGKRSLFTVEGVHPRESGLFFNGKVYGKNGTGK